MRVFQRTSRDTAADIRIMGFYDASDALGAGAQRMGVWVTNQPIDASDDAVATLVTLRIPITLFERHEHRHGYNGHRDAMIPADDLNACGQAHIVSAGAEARWMTSARDSREKTRRPSQLSTSEADYLNGYLRRLRTIHPFGSQQQTSFGCESQMRALLGWFPT
jgi:hypothetical protein